MGVNGIYGLSGSGLDVESMVKVGMLSKQSELDKMQQKYTKNEWKKSQYLDLYGEIQTFNSSTLSQYKLSSSMNARSASSSNSSAVTATANATAATMTHYVEVNELASAAYLIGTKLDRVDTSGDHKNQLRSTLFYSLEKDGDNVKYKYTDNDSEQPFIAAATDTAFSFSINDGVNGMLNSSNDKAVTAYAVNGAEAKDSQTVVISALATGAHSTGSHREGITSDNKVLSLSFNTTLKPYLETNATDTSDALTYTFNDGKTTADISFSLADLNDTFEDFLKNLNKKFSEKGLTLEAMFTSEDSDNNGIYEGGILLQNTEVGSDSTFSITNSSISDSFKAALKEKNIAFRSGYFANMLFLGGSSETAVYNNFDSRNMTVQNGTNVQGSINGTSFSDLDATTNKNTILYNGVTYTAKQETGNDGVKITNGKPLTVSVTYAELLGGYTFNELASKINGLGTNVRATYDAVQDRFSIYNKESGEENNITLNFGAGTAANNAIKFFNSLGLTKTANGVLQGDTITFENFLEPQTFAGTNASVKIDGLDYDLSSNKTTVNGVVYSFQNKTAEGNKVAVSVTQDTEAIAKKVESFVDDYNALLTKLYKWYDEKPNSDYKPLTETQKAGMKQDQIEKWEEKAKAGLLYHDSTLSKVITEIRSAVSEKVEGVDSKYNTIFSLGISTVGLKGQLTLDKDKLNAALAEDPDAVYNIFAKLDSGEVYYYQKDKDTGKEFLSKEITGNLLCDEDDKPRTKIVERPAYNGIAQRLGDVFMTGMKNIKNVSGTNSSIAEDSDLNNLLRELQTKMSNFKKMMSAFESKLYKKYDAMESSLALLGAQLNYVTGAFQ